jgi:hypothetical protein
MYEPLATLKVRLGITSTDTDALLTQLQEAAEAVLHAATGRDFTATEFTEYFEGGRQTLVLANYPVTAITDICVDFGGEFPPESARVLSAFHLDLSQGVIHYIGGPVVLAPQAGLVNANLNYWAPAPRTVRVRYTVPGVVPFAAKEAVRRIVMAWYQQVMTAQSSGHTAITQERAGDRFVTFMQKNTDAIPQDARELIQMLRTRSV